MTNDLKQNDKDRLEKVLSFGEKIGACGAFYMDDEFWHYYKKGDADSKHCYRFLSKEDIHSDITRLNWKNSYNTDLDHVVNFYSNLGKKAELFEIGNTKK